MQRTTFIWPYSSSAVPNQPQTMFCFSIFANFDFNGFSVILAAILDRRYEPKTLVCNPIQSNELKNITYQFEENCAKIEDVRVPHWKTYKKAVMTSSNQNFENLRKVSSQIFVKTMWSKFQQNRSKIVEIRDDHRQTDRQTDTHTQTHTHTHTHRRTDRDRPGTNIQSWNDWI